VTPRESKTAVTTSSRTRILRHSGRPRGSLALVVMPIRDVQCELVVLLAMLFCCLGPLRDLVVRYHRRQADVARFRGLPTPVRTPSAASQPVPSRPSPTSTDTPGWRRLRLRLRLPKIMRSTAGGPHPYRADQHRQRRKPRLDLFLHSGGNAIEALIAARGDAPVRDSQ
jgi:hypothetical protein